MTEGMPFEVDLWSMKNTTAEGADCFKEQKMSIMFTSLNIVCGRVKLLDGWRR